MSRCRGEDGTNLSVVQGDILEVYFILEGISSEEISSVFFSCAEQSISEECEYSEEEGGYRLRLESDVTEGLAPIYGSYDLTVRFSDGNDFTALYEGDFAVLKKRNAIRGGDVGE